MQAAWLPRAIVLHLENAVKARTGIPVHRLTWSLREATFAPCERSASKFDASRGHETLAVLARLSLVDVGPPVPTRGPEPIPFPVPVRTLDAVHLASMEFLRPSGQRVEVASGDQRLVTAARAMGVEILVL